jgi:hypothetical protein
MAQTIIRALKFSDEIVSCYKDPAELVLFHDVEMKGPIREESVSLRNQFRHQLTRLCVMTETDTLGRPKGASSGMVSSPGCYRIVPANLN